MPIVVIFVVGFLLEVLWAFWDWINEHIALIGTIATTFAFFAMLWSAFETRKSASAAFRAVKTAESSLEEARKNFRKEAFNQRFSLLLEQHNVYLEKINTFVGSDQGWGFVEEIFQKKTHRAAFEKLRGHFMCSPYMRVLYHLLKFINEDYYGDKNDLKGQKKYSSLVRSLISNDVLFLIAVNSSYINEDGVINQYKDYQGYLQRFDFFDHADFSLLHHPTNTKKFIKDERNLVKIKREVSEGFNRYKFSNDKNAFYNYKPDISVSVILSYIYKSPKQKETEKWFDEVRDMIGQTVEKVKDSFKSNEVIYKNGLINYLDHYKTETLAPDVYNKELEGGELVNDKIITDFITCYENGNLHKLQVPAFYFYFYNNQRKGYVLVRDSNTLIDDIKECRNIIKIKNDFIQGEIYKTAVDSVINTLEEAKTRMHEQRHADGQTSG